MAPMATGMTAVERAAVAAFLSKTTAAVVDPDAGRCTTPAPPLSEAATLPQWNGWGNDPTNSRFQSAAAAGLTAQSVPRLTLKWAFGLPGVMVVSAQPTVFGGRVIVGSESGVVYALDAATGCVRWQFKAGAGVRSAAVVGRLAGDGPARYAAYFGDLRATVYAVDLATGEQLWSLKVEDHAWARITGGSTLFEGRLYVPVSSFEELPGARPDYPCCTFRGSVVAIDATTGKQIWKTYTIPEAPAIVGKNAAGTPLWKPAGAAIWAAPTIDAARRRVYVATGNAYTEPAAPTTDAVLALALDTGAVQWVSQVTPSDAFLVGCKAGNANCPDDAGPDFDFGNSPILRRLANGRTVIAIGQKSGVAFGLDPDNKGAVLWRYRAGRSARARVDVHRPRRRARREHGARRPQHGAPVPALRDARRAHGDLLRGRAPRGRRPARQGGRGLPDLAAAARPRPHPPLHALARAGAAGLRHDVRAVAVPARCAGAFCATSRRSRTGSRTPLPRYRRRG